MTERRSQLRVLDGLDPPDLWPEIRDRSPREVPSRGRGPRVVAAAVAFVVAAAGVAFAMQAFRAGEARRPASDPLASISVGWSELPNPPETLSGSAVVWTGSELLSWGGYRAPDDTDVADGYSFDPSTQKWSSLPPAPAGRTGSHAVWTGSEAIFWGGWDRQRSYSDGFAFDPEKQAWRTIASGPIEASTGTVVVWTGSEMIVWGGGKPGDRSNSAGAAYDPSSDTWRPIADAPLGLNAASAVWTGTDVIVFGSLLDGGNHASTPTSVGAAYDPATDSWRELPASDLSPQAIAAVWLGDRMIAYDYGWKAESYAPSSNEWRSLPSLPFRDGECYPDGAVVGSEVFAFGCGEAATLSLGDDAWREVHGGLTDATIHANAGEYKLWRFASLVPAGEVLFLSAEGITVNQQGTPCYGCQAAPHSLWAYRPEAAASNRTEPPPSSGPASFDVRVITTNGVAPHPSAVAAGEGGVWVTSCCEDGSGAGQVIRLDPRNGNIVARIAVKATPGWEFGGAGLALGDGSVWTVGASSNDAGCCNALVTRIDPSTDSVVDEIAVPGLTEGDLWVDGPVVYVIGFTAEENGSSTPLQVAKIDTASHAIEWQKPVPGQWSQTVFVAGGSVWVLGTAPDASGPVEVTTLYRVDPSSGEVQDQIGLPGSVYTPVVYQDAVWFRIEGGVQEFDPASGSFIGDPIQLGAGCCDGPFVADGSGGVWLDSTAGSNLDHMIWHVDGSGEVVASSAIDRQSFDEMQGQSFAFDPSTQTIWSQHYEDSIARAEIRLGNS
jgi:N-acetylneuraminic acid mutarotase